VFSFVLSVEVLVKSATLEVDRSSVEPVTRRIQARSAGRFGVGMEGSGPLIRPFASGSGCSRASAYFRGQG
jgi:hypothetical protein